MNLPRISRNLIKVLAVLAFVTFLVAVVVVPVAADDPLLPGFDVPQGYAFIGAIPKSLHLDVRHYWTALFALVCIVGCGLIAREPA